jgi:hypothetical protein
MGKTLDSLRGYFEGGEIKNEGGENDKTLYLKYSRVNRLPVSL